MKFKNLKIGVRLSAAFSVVLVLTALMTGIGIWQLSRVAAAKNEMTKASQTKQLAEEWMRGIATNSVRTFAKAKINNLDDQIHFEKEMAATSKRISEVQKELDRVVTSEEGKRHFNTVAEMRNSYSAVRDQVFKLKNENASETELKSLIDQEMVPAMNAYIDSVQKVLNFQSKLFDNANAHIDEVYESSKLLLAGLGALAVALGTLLAWRLSISITRPLQEAVDIAQTVASGDLSSQIDVRTQCEFGRLKSSLRKMNESLFKAVLEVRAGTDMIATASQHIAAGNLDLSSRTEQQASSLEETASSMEEFTATVRQNSEHARQANTLAIDASSAAAEGGKIIEEVVGTMSDISASAKQVVDIISVIDSIAFQTNILALNAAVEAARAGEQGRGFAVVASEVRTLAQRSAVAAKEIKTLINNSVERVDAGSRLVDAAGSSMQNIVDSVRRVTNLISEISAASVEQTAGIDQINQAIAQMDQVTQQNASLVQKAAAASESMQGQAVKLAQAVSVFKLGAAHGRAFADDVKTEATTTSAPRLLSTFRENASPGMRRSSYAVRELASSPKDRRQRQSVRVDNVDEWEEF